MHSILRQTAALCIAAAVLPIAHPSLPAFEFSLVRETSGRKTEEFWLATATFAPPGTRPPEFRIRFDTVRHDALEKGATVHGAFLRAATIDGIGPWFALTNAFPPAGSGGLAATPVDSVVFSAVVQATADKGTWIGEVHLENGARFLMVLKTGTARGALRPISDRYNIQVLSAFLGLGAARQR